MGMVERLAERVAAIVGSPVELERPADPSHGDYATNVALGTPQTSDNNAVASVTHDAPAQFPVGTTTVTWTATDASGNSATATQLVTVNDVEDPTISAPAAAVVSSDAGACYATSVALGSPVTGDNCEVASVTNDAPAQFAGRGSHRAELPSPALAARGLP